ncbi:GNAT family N-acetyltransferase [Phenylobacterium sp. LjRoot164]|uniref:GNAT family N-acetyltransferase n=1 Tax=unclassified Phenylobacterium TaxID=2640670 RepID=UPI003ECF3527
MIQTERLILRAYREEDRADFAALNGDPQVGAWLGGTLDRAGSDALLDRFNAQIAEHGWGPWAVERKSDGRLIGMTGLACVNEALPVSPATEIEWRLIPAAWGQGYASEAARAVLDWAFANLDQDEFLAFTADTNLASQGVMRKIGMVADPARDFDHPNLAADHPLNRHVVYVARR